MIQVICKDCGEIYLIQCFDDLKCYKCGSKETI